ncbi:hypothetical protein [Streptomyces panaciradicis]|uniref:hypothetical protein n=1 Tax=Streptomyces panaciradicis TaxID=1470261 RepID=UPI00201D0163|nr:hypothetical protein [Streptomyces panaciradicis]MCL6672256.1 hypothetical protein [Streptomyces panaciradicis]
MRKSIKGAAAVAIATAAAAVLSVGTAEAKPAADSWGTCPSGAVCIFPQGVNPGDTQTTPTNTYWSYGAHNLSGQYGWHWVYNNQTGGAHAHLCKGYNGVNCDGDLAPGVAYWVDLTPVNSITLDRP